MRYQKYLSSLSLAAILFFIIGTGNMLTGYLKINTIDKALEAPAEANRDIGNHKLRVERFNSKKHFYKLVSRGGVCFLLVSAALLGIDILRRRRT